MKLLLVCMFGLFVYCNAGGGLELTERDDKPAAEQTRTPAHRMTSQRQTLRNVIDGVHCGGNMYCDYGNSCCVPYCCGSDTYCCADRRGCCTHGSTCCGHYCCRSNQRCCGGRDCCSSDEHCCGNMCCSGQCCDASSCCPAGTVCAGNGRCRYGKRELIDALFAKTSEE